jgi:hypothetical protein
MHTIRVSDILSFRAIFIGFLFWVFIGSHSTDMKLEHTMLIYIFRVKSKKEEKIKKTNILFK